MKNIHEILKGFGFELPADKKADFDKAVKENYSPIAELEKVRTSRDNYKSQLDTATAALKEFEGVDVKDLQGKITTLNKQLSDQKADFEQQIADRDFNALLDGAITDSKAKNVKAVRSQLDIEKLRASKNQGEDIKAAIAKVKEESDYLFEPAEPIDKAIFVDSTNGKTPSVKTNEELNGMNFAEYRKYRQEN